MRIETLERIEFIVPFLFFVWRRKKIVPRDATCLLTQCDASEIRHLLLADDGNVYDALALLEWTRRCRRKGKGMVQVIPGMPIRTCTPAMCEMEKERTQTSTQRKLSSPILERGGGGVRKKRMMMERVLLSYHPRYIPTRGKRAKIPSDRSAFVPYTAC